MNTVLKKFIFGLLIATAATLGTALAKQNTNPFVPVQINQPKMEYTSDNLTELIDIYFEQERYSECYQECNKVISLSGNKLLSKKAKNDLKKTRKILEKCLKEMKARELLDNPDSQ